MRINDQRSLARIQESSIRDVCAFGSRSQCRTGYGGHTVSSYSTTWKVLLATLVALGSFALPAYDQVREKVVEQLVGQDEDNGSEGAEHEDDDHEADDEQESVHHQRSEPPQGEMADHRSEPSEHEHAADEEGHGEAHRRHKIVVTSPVVKDVTLTQSYVCKIHSRRHIEVRALESGYLEAISIREGQQVKEGDVLFRILPTIYLAKRDGEKAEAQLCQVEYDNTKKLMDQNIVSIQELKLAEAKLLKAQSQVKLAEAELNFATVRAPFDGIVDRLHEQQGSLIEESAKLTTLSDNSVMWVYFNVPEARYFEYQAAMQDSQGQAHLDIELKLANHEKFPHPGKIGAIEADFDSETGNIAFRADFPNPDGLLRHGQTGTILIHQVTKNALVIPQRATFQTLAKNYAFVIDKDGIVRQREIVIKNELEDIFVLESGLNVGDKIVLEGILQVRDGDHVDYDFRAPEEVLSNLKYHAE